MRVHQTDHSNFGNFTLSKVHNKTRKQGKNHILFSKKLVHGQSSITIVFQNLINKLSTTNYSRQVLI